MNVALPMSEVGPLRVFASVAFMVVRQGSGMRAQHRGWAAGPGVRSPARPRGRAAPLASSAASTPLRHIGIEATANGACARTPEPPALPVQPDSPAVTPPAAGRCSRGSSQACHRGCHRAVVVPAGGGPIRGRLPGRVLTEALKRCCTHAPVRDREGGPGERRHRRRPDASCRHAYRSVAVCNGPRADHHAGCADPEDTSCSPRPLPCSPPPPRSRASPLQRRPRAPGWPTCRARRTTR